jgi:hypothetical protein
LTQAASRRSINARAIFRASFRDPQVTNTTILSLIDFAGSPLLLRLVAFFRKFEFQATIQ